MDFTKAGQEIPDGNADLLFGNEHGRVSPRDTLCDIRDSELGDLLDLPVVVATEYQNWHPDGLEWPRQTPPSSSLPSGSELSDEEMRLLEAVVGDPGKPSSTYLKPAPWVRDGRLPTCENAWSRKAICANTA